MMVATGATDATDATVETTTSEMGLPSNNEDEPPLLLALVTTGYELGCKLSPGTFAYGLSGLTRVELCLISQRGFTPVSSKRYRQAGRQPSSTVACGANNSNSNTCYIHLDSLQDTFLYSPIIMKTIASLLFALLASATAFAPVSHTFRTSKIVSSPIPLEARLPASLQRQRKSVANVQTMGLFGLGVPEIAIILIAAAFLLGPQKLAELGKDAGKIAGELKEVPKEFQKGLEEGEKRAKEVKALDAAEVKKDDAL
jgi:sec-independent protein translocase protein TatA